MEVGIYRKKTQTIEWVLAGFQMISKLPEKYHSQFDDGQFLYFTPAVHTDGLRAQQVRALSKREAQSISVCDPPKYV